MKENDDFHFILCKGYVEEAVAIRYQ